MTAGKFWVPNCQCYVDDIMQIKEVNPYCPIHCSPMETRGKGGGSCPFPILKVTGSFTASGHDPVNNPDHYTAGGIECIDYLRAKLTPEQFKGFCLGNAMKYLSRAGKKDNEREQYKKAEWYIRKLIDAAEKPPAKS